MAELFEEPPGYISAPGYVKSNPKNNDHYLEQFEGHPWFPAIKRCHERLQELVPGYNIRQIKEKFGGLRYYIDGGECRKDSWEAHEAEAREITYSAEAEVAEFERRKRS